MTALNMIGRLALLALVTVSPARYESAQTRDPAPPARLPARLEHFIETVIQPTAAERKRLLDGAPITKFLDADPKSEVALFGAIWISADPHRYVAAVQDIEHFESGDAFIITKRISTPPRIEDFAALKLSPDDFNDLRTCRVGKCELKLDQAAIDRIRRDVDWNKPTATSLTEQILRQLAYDYVKGYRENGNAGLAVYRDKDRPTFVADEFKSMIERMPELAIYLPELRAYLLNYPNASLEQSTDFLYWQETRFGLKPTVRVNHLVIQEGTEETVVASKMLYAGHYFWTGLELRVLIPDLSRGSGFWFVNVNRGRSDGLDGFTGSLVRGRVRSQAQESLARSLTATKKKLEGVR
jgi:hypothetical protein